MAKNLFQKIGWQVDLNEGSETPKVENTKPTSNGFPKTVKEDSFKESKSFPVTPPTKEHLSFEDDYSFEENKITESTSSATPIQKTENNRINPHLQSTIELYDKGFSEMNKDGIDFYEFFLNITTSGNIDKPELYPMVFNMHKSLDVNFTKESVLANAEYYSSKIIEAHTNMKNNGMQKLNTLESDKKQEKSSLEGEIQSLEGKIRELTAELNIKKSELGTIDLKYTSSLQEVNLKLDAHDIAKGNLIDNIQKVVNNINQTI